MIWAAEGSPHRDEVFSRGHFTRVLDVRSSFKLSRNAATILSSRLCSSGRLGPAHWNRHPRADPIERQRGSSTGTCSSGSPFSVNFRSKDFPSIVPDTR